MDQVGVEPTSSRSTGEVTLPYTTSNFIATTAPVLQAGAAFRKRRKIAPGGKSRRDPGVTPGRVETK